MTSFISPYTHGTHTRICGRAPRTKNIRRIEKHSHLSKQTRIMFYILVQSAISWIESVVPFKPSPSIHKACHLSIPHDCSRCQRFIFTNQRCNMQCNKKTKKQQGVRLRRNTHHPLFGRQASGRAIIVWWWNWSWWWWLGGWLHFAGDFGLREVNSKCLYDPRIAFGTFAKFFHCQLAVVVLDLEERDKMELLSMALHVVSAEYQIHKYRITIFILYFYWLRTQKRSQISTF